MAAAIKPAEIPAGLRRALGRVHAATMAIGQGDLEPYMRAWSRADDVSVTYIYRNEDGEWRLVHRHGDFAPIDESDGKLD